MAPSSSASGRMKKGLVISIVVVVVLGGLELGMGESGCTSVLITLAPCLNYVSGSASTPSTSCCSQLGTVVQSQPRCLCMLLNGGATSLGVTLNETLALALPAACNVETPPVSRCNAGAGDGSAIVSPASSPTAASPSGGGSNAAESASTSQASANSMKKNKYLHFFTATLTLLVAMPMVGGGGS